MRAERDRRAAILNAEGVKQSQILTAEGEKQSAVLKAEGARTAAILRSEGEAKAIDTVFRAIHEGAPDQALLSYQYLQMLPQLAQGEANKIFIIPSEFSQALGNLGDVVSKVTGGERPPRRPAAAGRTRPRPSRDERGGRPARAAGLGRGPPRPAARRRRRRRSAWPSPSRSRAATWRRARAARSAPRSGRGTSCSPWASTSSLAPGRVDRARRGHGAGRRPAARRAPPAGRGPRGARAAARRRWSRAPALRDVLRGRAVGGGRRARDRRPRRDVESLAGFDEGPLPADWPGSSRRAASRCGATWSARPRARSWPPSRRAAARAY